MATRIPKTLLATAVILLGVDLAARLGALPGAYARTDPPTHEVLRARLIELVAADGRVVGQLHTGEDGSGHLRLRSGKGEVGVKLGASDEGSALILMDRQAEPALWLAAQAKGTTLTLAQAGKPARVLVP